VSVSGLDPAYIARADCGCIVAATIDRPEYRKDVARDTADWIKRGYSIERTTVAEAKADPNFLTWPCPYDGDHAQGRLPVTDVAREERR
jgi:hypothetical protein